jgi:exonuclease VII small subunit
MNYNEAFEKLEGILLELEEGTIPLDQLAAKVKEANARTIQTEIEATAPANTSAKKKS